MNIRKSGAIPRSRKERSAELDAQNRSAIVEVAEDRMLEAVSCGLLTQAFLFGHPVALIKLVRDGKDFVKVYRPGEESRAAGYVPRLWLELGGSNQDDGCLLEVWPDTEDLVQPVDTPEGQRPLPMPVTNARVLTVRALNVLRDGTIVSPAEALS